MTAVHGLTDMLMVANQFIDELERKDQSIFCVTHWELGSENRQLQRRFSSPLEGSLEQQPEQQQIVVVPGSLGPGALDDLHSSIFDWIRTQYEGGAIVTSICKGTFVLAQSGILKHRTATTHWAFQEKFAAQFPEVHLKIDKIIVDEGDIITAGGGHGLVGSRATFDSPV